MKVNGNKEFSLRKVKLGKTGGLKVQYEITVKEGEEIYKNRYVVENDRIIHSDLKDLFDGLREYVVDLLNMRTFLFLFNNSELTALANNITQSVLVKGLTITGKESHKGVVILADYVTEGRQRASIKTHKLKIDDIHYEDDILGSDITKIEQEVYLYLFEGKQAQLSVFGEDN